MISYAGRIGIVIGAWLAQPIGAVLARWVPPPSPPAITYAFALGVTVTVAYLTLLESRGKREWRRWIHRHYREKHPDWTPPT